MTSDRWTNQEEAYRFTMSHDAAMLNMDMGTGKTRVAIDATLDRVSVTRVLVVCPKTVIPVWKTNLEKFAGGRPWKVYDKTSGTIKTKCQEIVEFMMGNEPCTRYAVVNYDIVWREPLGDALRRIGFDAVILDESHRAKSAGSKVSKYLYLLGKSTPFRLCLSGTPMANSPLDVYGQYRFLDRSIFGTNFNLFKEQYAVLAGPERRFIVGYKNLDELNQKFQSIAYTCKMSDVKDRLKLPDVLPPTIIPVTLPPASMKLIRELGKEFVAEIEDSGSFVVLKNVLSRIIRFQQISSGFVPAQEGPLEPIERKMLHREKEDALVDILSDLPATKRVVVFGAFHYDLDSIMAAANRSERGYCEISGRVNEYKAWSEGKGTVLGIQLQSGSEGIDLTSSEIGIYYTLPYSLALFEQSKSRLYRPGQTSDVRFMYILAKDTIDEDIYECLRQKRDLIRDIQENRISFKFMR